MRRGTRALVAAALASTGLLLGVLLPSVATAGDLSLPSIGVRGAFAPSDDDIGHRYKFLGRSLVSAFGDRLEIGAEIELSKYSTMLAGLPGIQVKSYNIRTVLLFVPWPDRVSPYVGTGLGVDVMRLDDDMVESVIQQMRVDNFGIRMGGVSFLGIQLPVARDAVLFAEGRAAAAFQVIDATDVEMGAGIFEGVGAIAGLRMRF